jgi:hypothetical protein
MLTTIALTLVLSCKRPPMPDELVVRRPLPVLITACEGPDRVTRNLNGVEVRRATFACAPRPEPRLQPTPQPDVLKFGLSVR